MLLTAFGAIMVATNVFNDALGVPLDGYLEPYRRAAMSVRPGRAGHRRRPRPGPRHGARARRAGYDIAALDVAAPLAYPGYAMGTPDELESLAAECPAACADCRRRRARRRRRQRPRSPPRSTRFGRIDVLFNNAGICAYGLAHELTEDEWDAMLDINLKGAVDRRPPRDPAHDRGAAAA